MTKTTVTPIKEFRVCLSEQLEKFCKEQSLPNWCCDDPVSYTHLTLPTKA